ncbi:DUF5723 family protein [Candidatus Neomarinimicrobiota bacterium]
MRFAILLWLVAGVLHASGLPDSNPVRTATAGAWFTRAKGNHALSLNPANLGYYGKPVMLGLPQTAAPTLDEASVRDHFSVQLIASPDVKLVQKTRRAFHRRTGGTLPSAILLADSLYKLQVGLFADRGAAETLRDSLMIAGYPDAWIVAATHAPVDFVPAPYTTLTLMGASLYARNNAIYPRWINRQLFGNLDLHDPEKKDLFLSVFPSDGWNLNLMAGANSLSFTLGNWGVSLIAPKVISGLNFPTAIMDVLFRGVRFDQPRDLSGLQADLLAAAPLSVAYGRQVEMLPLSRLGGRFYAGVGLNLLLGVADVHLETDHLYIKTTPDSVLISGRTRLLSNNNPTSSAWPALGTGVSFDLGLTADLGRQLSIGLALKDLFGKLTWPHRYTTVNEFSMHLSVENIKDMVSDYDVQLDSLRHRFDQSDTTYASGSGRTVYPSQFTFGASWDALPPLTIDASFTHFFNSDYLESAAPRLSVGLEYAPTPVFPIYAGIAVGGWSGFTWGTGFTLNVGAFQWNLGFGQHGGMFNAARGADLSTEFRLVF